MPLRLPFDTTFARLPERLYAAQRPTPVPAPRLIALNRGLARQIGLDPEMLASDEGIAMLAGNTLPEGSAGLSMAYAGHQFGGWAPRLGDGRAILLGEVVGPDGRRRDVQLKGAGRTPFSRSGDGRAWIGPVLREYLVSEAMAALGVPTSRALACVLTGDDILREEGMVPGAILTRVAASHIRVGTFQYFAARQDHEALAALADHVIARHYPQADGPLGLLRAVVAAQAHLIAGWMAVGFIHGVMNTDNMTVSGETIDYGPCAFMDGYHPRTVFSSIDMFGRYAYANQPQIGVWNLAQFATALLPLMGEKSAAIEAATEAVHGFTDIYQAAWLAAFRAKLGLGRAEDGDADLIEALLALMAGANADFTRTFRAMAEDGDASAEFADPAPWQAWAQGWQARLAREGTDKATARARMRAANPAIIPRNHQVQAAIVAALGNDFAPFERLHAALAQPFDPAPGTDAYRAAPAPAEVVRMTFCGT
ncbi:MAG: YdiU family protein [Rhodobacteraceae bacterium]|jgi:uncharacterized protein YdiU (UPF0061 family)|nr:YdiU family protein [Paracoccaceae bacterium]